MLEFDGTGVAPRHDETRAAAERQIMAFVATKRFSDLEEELLSGGESMLTQSGIRLSAAQALRVSTVFACRRVIAEDIATMRIEVVRRSRDKATQLPKTEVLEDHYLNPLLNITSGTPNEWMTISELIEHWVGTATMYPGGYVYVTRNGDEIDGRGMRRAAGGEVLELLPLMPGAVSVYQASDWTPLYHVNAYGESWWADRANLLRLHGPMADNALAGMAVSHVAREAIALASAVEAAAARFHKNDMRPAGALAIKNKALTLDQLKEMKRDWDQRFSQGGEGGIALLMDDIEFKAFNATSADSQTLENRKMQVEEICRFFRVFPVAIGHQAGQGYGTTENFFDAHYTHTLKPWETKIEQALNATLLSREDRRAGISIRLRPARRGTFSDRMRGYNEAVKTTMTPNECRAEEGLDPLPGEAMNMVQLQANNTGIMPQAGGKPALARPGQDKPGPEQPRQQPGEAAPAAAESGDAPAQEAAP